MRMVILIGLVTLSACGLSNRSYFTHSYSEQKGQNTLLPFKREYTSRKKALYVYGSYHTNDTTDQEIRDIENTLKAFAPQMVLYEGDNIGVEKSKNESIQYYFEMGLVRWLAKRAGIAEMTLEPEAFKKHQWLLRKYDKDTVLLATILGQNILFIVKHTPQEFKALYPTIIEDLIKEGFPLKETEKQFDYFSQLYRNFYKQEFHPQTFDYQTVEIKFDRTFLNEINRQSASFRDQTMLHKIDSCLKKYDRIFVQVGGRHAIVWQLALRRMIK